MQQQNAIDWKKRKGGNVYKYNSNNNSNNNNSNSKKCNTQKDQSLIIGTNNEILQDTSSNMPLLSTIEWLDKK